MHGTRFSWKKIYFDIRCALQKFILCFFLFSFFVFFVSNTTKTRQIAFYERHVIRSNSKENNNGNVKVVYYISLEFQCCEFLWHPTTLAHVSSYFFFLFFFSFLAITCHYPPDEIIHLTNDEYFPRDSRNLIEYISIVFQILQKCASIQAIDKGCVNRFPINCHVTISCQIFREA